MKKVLLLLLASLVAFLPTLVSASARIEALSADERIVEDYDLIWMYPNKVLEYKNTVDYRLGDLTGANGTGDDWAGALDGQHGDYVTGAYIRRPFDLYNTGGVAPQDWDTFANRLSGGAAIPFVAGTVTTPENKVDLFFGKALSSVDLGVQINYGSAKDNPSTNTTTTSTTPAGTTENVNKSSVLGLRLGVGKKDLGPFSQANFSLGYTTGSFELSNSVSTVPGTNNQKSDGISAIQLGALFQKDNSETTNTRLFVDATIAKFAAVATTSTGGSNDTFSTESSDMSVNVGLGCNHKVNEGSGLVSGGLILKYTSDKATASATDQGAPDDLTLEEDNTSSIALPWYVSVEGRVASWLTLRAGANANIFQSTTNETINTPVAPGTNTVTTETKSDDKGGINFNTGFGINWKNFTLDAVLDTAYLEDTVINNVQPGRGLLFGGADTVVVTKADLRYRF